MYEEENTINKKLGYVKKTNEKIRRGLRLIFYTKKSFSSPLSKRKDRVATKDKTNILRI